MNNQFDSIIVGGGIVGLGVALGLSQRQQRVLLLEAHTLGCGTSGATFAWINASSKAGHSEYFDLNHAGLHRYRTLAAELGEPSGVHFQPMYSLGRDSDQQTIDDLRQQLQNMQAHGYPSSWVHAADLPRTQDLLVSPEKISGWCAPEEAFLDTATWLNNLRRRLESLGCTIYEHCPVDSMLLDDDGRVYGARCKNQDYLCRDLVMTTGPDTPEMLSKLTGFDDFGRRFPMYRAPGLLLQVPWSGLDRLNSVIYLEGTPEAHIRPLKSGWVLAGSDETDGLISEDMPVCAQRDVAFKLLITLESWLQDFYADELIDHCRWKIGIRSVPSDGYSIAGPMPDCPGLHVVCTHSGITLSLILGELVAQSIVSGRIPDQLHPFLFDRFVAKPGA